MKFGALLLLCCLDLCAQSHYSVFSQGNFEGLKDEHGEVVLPATFDKLGWSDGTDEVRSSTIGFLENEKWGLISTDGKRKTSAVYDKITPLLPGKLLIATKGRFTNRFFYGIIDTRGKVLISQDYFDIELVNGSLLVTVLDGVDFKVGLLSQDLRFIAPVEYEEVRLFDAVVICQNKSSELDLFDITGASLGKSFDRVRQDGNFLITSKNGFDGLVSSQGEVVYEPIYKKIKSSKEVIDFPTWEIIGQSENASVTCDSVTFLNTDLWLMHLSGVVKFQSDKLNVGQGHYELKQILDGHTVMKSIPEGTWIGFDNYGKKVVESSDSIHFDGKYFLVDNNERWIVFNGQGSRVHHQHYDEVKPLNSRFLAVKKFGYWAILDGIEKEISKYIYDDVMDAHGTRVIARYLGKMGVVRKEGAWIIGPYYDKIAWENEHYIAQKGRSWFLFSRDGHKLFETIDEIVPRDGFFVLKYADKYSALNRFGRPIANTEYANAQKFEDFFELESDYSILKDQSGKIIIPKSSQVEDVQGFSEGLFLIKKNGSFGFVDVENKLRIANRYEQAKAFSEGMAAVKLRNRWGFIDRNERLVIQPHYISVTPFQNGISVFEMDGLFGFMTLEGKEISKAVFSSVSKQENGQFLIQTTNQKFGIADEKGIIRVTPTYDELILFNDFWRARIGSKWGLLSPSGKIIVPVKYSELRIDQHGSAGLLD